MVFLQRKPSTAFRQASRNQAQGFSPSLPLASSAVEGLAVRFLKFGDGLLLLLLLRLILPGQPHMPKWNVRLTNAFPTIPGSPSVWAIWRPCGLVGLQHPLPFGDCPTSPGRQASLKRSQAFRPRSKLLRWDAWRGRSLVLIYLNMKRLGLVFPTFALLATCSVFHQIDRPDGEEESGIRVNFSPN